MVQRSFGQDRAFGRQRREVDAQPVDGAQRLEQREGRGEGLGRRAALADREEPDPEAALGRGLGIEDRDELAQLADEIAMKIVRIDPRADVQKLIARLERTR